MITLIPRDLPRHDQELTDHEVPWRWKVCALLVAIAATVALNVRFARAVILFPLGLWFLLEAVNARLFGNVLNGIIIFVPYGLYAVAVGILLFTRDKAFFWPAFLALCLLLLVNTVGCHMMTADNVH